MARGKRIDGRGEYSCGALESTFIPKDLNHELRRILPNYVGSANTKFYIKDALSKGWRIFVTNQKRGRCYDDKVITIPAWTFQNEDKGETGRVEYYLAHELAHIYAGIHNQHNAVFMEWLIKICPEKYLHYELEYKPKNAAAAGILPEF